MCTCENVFECVCVCTRANKCVCGSVQSVQVHEKKT